MTLRSVLLRMRNALERTADKIITCILFSITPPPKKKSCPYAIRKNMAESDGSQMAIRGVCSACWVTKVTYICTYTHTYIHIYTQSLRNCNTYCFCKAAVVARERLTVTFTHAMHILVWYNVFGHCRLELRKCNSRFMIPIYEWTNETCAYVPNSEWQNCNSHFLIPFFVSVFIQRRFTERHS